MIPGSKARVVAAGSGVPRCVPWQPKYREGVLKLFRDVPYKAELWHWQFESNPFGLPFTPVVLVDDEDTVVGFNGVMAARATDQGEAIRVLWSCDFYLAEPWRGQGLGHVIIEHAQSLAAQAGAQCLTLTVDEQNTPAQRVYAQAGFIQLGRERLLGWY